MKWYFNFRKMHRKILLILWIFLLGGTSKSQEVKYSMTVAQDGSGDFTTIQAAIDATKAFPDKRITIFVKNGVYHEKVRVPSWNNLLSIIGEDREKTIISRGDYFDQIGRGRNSTFFTYTFLVEADDFYAENLTIENIAGQVGQAVALHVEGNRCAFVNCRILGNQDTLYVSGEGCRQLFRNSYIEGTTDFIFGSATAVFDNCKVMSKSDSYITAASTPQGAEFGFVFRNCKIESISGVSKVYLGRPWRIYAKTAFLNCFLGSHILPEGWHNWNKPEAEKTSFYTEFGNSGPGANMSKRVLWAHSITSKQAKKYTDEKILGSWVLELR
jgi:pectinesterase